MSLEQSLESFNKLVIASSKMVKDLHLKYGSPNDPVPAQKCDEMVRELELANSLANAKMRPSWEFYRDCCGVKHLITNKIDEFFLEGAKRIRRKNYVRADIGPVWNKMTKDDQNVLWKQFTRAWNLAEKIHFATSPEEQQRLLRTWP